MTTKIKKASPTILKLVNLLNDGHYHDGTNIGTKLKITRSAVWKIIKKLQGYGIQIDSVKGKGYALLEPLILLDNKLIKNALANYNVKLEIFESVASTNQYLQKKADKNILVCLSEEQTLGKGRLERYWYSPFGQNIYLSCKYSFQKDVSELSGLSLVVSLAIVKTLQHYKLPHSILTKWPNDITYHNQKICGILVEIQAESHGKCEATIGIGINVNMLDDDNCINQAWTSLRKILGEYIDRNHLTVLLLENLFAYLEKFKKKGFAPFTEEWNTIDSLYNKKITLNNLNNKETGIAKGVDDSGYLILKTNEKLKSYSSGDTLIVK